MLSHRLKEAPSSELNTTLRDSRVVPVSVYLEVRYGHTSAWTSGGSSRCSSLSGSVPCADSALALDGPSG